MTFVRLIRQRPLPSRLADPQPRLGPKCRSEAVRCGIVLLGTSPVKTMRREAPDRSPTGLRLLAMVFCGGFLGPVLLACGAFACLALLALLVVLAAFLESFGELLLARQVLDYLLAALDLDARRLLDEDAVLARDFGRHQELLAAQVELLRFGHVGGERRVRPGRKRRFKAREGRVGRRFEARVGDAFFDVGLAVEYQLDAFALKHELDVGEGGVAVRDEIRGTRERVFENRRFDVGAADVRAFRAARRVFFEDFGQARFLDRRQARRQLDRQGDEDFGDVALTDPFRGRDYLEPDALFFAPLSFDFGFEAWVEVQFVTAIQLHRGFQMTSRALVADHLPFNFQR